MHIKQIVQCAASDWPPYEDIVTYSSRPSCYQSSSYWSYKTYKLLSSIKGENQPECQACQSSLTVKHILIDCNDFSAVRQRYFRVDTLKELFEIVESRNIIAFIKDINFYHCIYSLFYIG